MAKAENKTQPTTLSVKAYLEAITDEAKKQDALLLFNLFNKLIPEVPIMWGESIVGYGRYHYKSKSGREGDWFKVGFSCRKQNFSIYLISGLEMQSQNLTKLGKHKTGVGCLYINKVKDIDIQILEDMITSSYTHWDK